MALIDDVKDVLKDLIPHGWSELFAAHGLDITIDDNDKLVTELTKKLDIKRNIPGFEDFAEKGVRAIEARDPARSLLFHALASPNVIKNNDGTDLRKFPTLKQIEVVENFIYGIEPLSQSFIDNNAKELTIVVFASEYRSALETPHRSHADMCFSRTGIARVGTSSAKYDKKYRGFIQGVDDQPHNIRVLPCKYSAYIAISKRGNKDKFRPMNFKTVEQDGKSDALRDFWIPIHKLFNGPECIKGLDLQVNLTCKHVNEKIKKIHEFLNQKRPDNREHSGPKLQEPDFTFTDRIANIFANSEFGTGVVEPIQHEKLIAPAQHNGVNLTFQVPRIINPRQDGINLFSSSLELRSPGDGRPVPEYVHVRHEIDDQGNLKNLNNEIVGPDDELIQKISRGNYSAQHYVDFSGDGWVKVLINEEIKNKISEIKSAYSLVTAPDFFLNSNQRQVMEWESTGEGNQFHGGIWESGGPDPLSQMRFPANVATFPNEFSIGDDTISAIVSLHDESTNTKFGELDRSIQNNRHSFLPDNAAGVFAPGWDVSTDVTNNRQHLAAYGLGSPFPEDAKLCAVLSSFWPAASPDTGRTFGTQPTVIPLTDEELGSDDNLSWDGIKGPIRVGNTFEYTRFEYADYVDSAMNNLFSSAQTNLISTNEYNLRISYMMRTYATLRTLLGNIPKRVFIVSSFKKIRHDNNEFRNILDNLNINVGDLQEPFFKFEIFNQANITISPDNNKKIRRTIDNIWQVYVTKTNLFIKQNNDPWISL